MEERKKPAEPEGRRRKQENPLLQKESQRRVNTKEREYGEIRRKQNVYKLRILTIILILLILMLIAAFVSEIWMYRQPAGSAGNNVLLSADKGEEYTKVQENTAWMTGSLLPGSAGKSRKSRN